MKPIDGLKVSIPFPSLSIQYLFLLPNMGGMGLNQFIIY